MRIRAHVIRQKAKERKEQKLEKQIELKKQPYNKSDLVI